MPVIIKKTAHELRIYKFGPETDGNAQMKDVLGGKGAGLAEMCNLGIPVPPGFTLPCFVSTKYNKLALPAEFMADVMKQVSRGMVYLQKEFGYLPLVSVRSGARVSMPGMMDTILNVGLTTTNLPEWVQRIGERATYDSYRRLIQMYGSVVLSIPMAYYEDLITETRASQGVATDAELDAAHLRRLCNKFLALTGDFPADSAEAQMQGAVEAVFRSWNNERAIEYRKLYEIPDSWGTAVNVQAMVFGNADEDSCSGVLFTRDPSTGQKTMTGDFLPIAQGEDVVAGIRSPEPIFKLPEWDLSVSTSLFEVAAKLEHHFKDMQDIEFTVQSSKLYVLQCRTGKRLSQAAFKIAHDMVVEGLIDKEAAVSRVSHADLLRCFTRQIAPSFKKAPDLQGFPAGGGIVTGVAVMTAEAAINCTEPCILVRKETDPDDFAGMVKAVGILTATGGSTCHAAVVARGMNKTCVVGATKMKITGTLASIEGGPMFTTGQVLTIDGTTGNVWLDEVPTTSGEPSEEVRSLAQWAIEGDDTVAERLSLYPSMNPEDAYKMARDCRSPRVQFDLAALVDPETGMLNQTAAKEVGRGLGDNTNLKSVLIDARLPNEIAGGMDDLYEAMFGQPVMVQTDAPAIFLAWPEKVREISTVKYVAPALREAYIEMGFKVGGAVKSFADLLSAQGAVDVPEDVIEKVFGGQQAFEVARSLTEQHTGNKVYAARALYWHDFMRKK